MSQSQSIEHLIGIVRLSVLPLVQPCILQGSSPPHIAHTHTHSLSLCLSVSLTYLSCITHVLLYYIFIHSHVYMYLVQNCPSNIFPCSMKHPLSGKFSGIVSMFSTLIISNIPPKQTHLKSVLVQELSLFLCVLFDMVLCC